MQTETAADTNGIQGFIKALQDHHRDPHHFFGLHKLPDGRKVIRLWRPGASQITIELFGQMASMQRIYDLGLFELTVPEHTAPLDYRVYHQSGLLAHDPYAFLPTASELDLYLFGKGVHYQLYNLMGAKSITHQGVQGVKFLVWAPEAKRVSLVGDFNYWDGRVNPMRCLGVSGVWELFVPGLKAGEKYKFEVKNKWGQLVVKADPYAFSTELRPATASVVAEIDRFQWTDQEWINRRSHTKYLTRPLNIYEVHLGSWRTRGNGFLNYREIGRELAAYCKDMGYTHVELLPVQEHPLDESWGYQVSGFYAVTSRYGSPEDFQWFVNHMHENNIGVIVDWVPGHFPTDDFSLGRFDGTSLYEHEDSRQGFHPHWNTYIFNFGRHEVTNFLIANALYWFEKMHIDGLRVDAVASMLYLDYGREDGQWIPNRYGGKENLEAIEFIKHLNSVVHQRHPGALMIAEESTSFTGVSHSLEYGGLGFDFKWNMGWMNDTLRYFSKDMIFRHYHHNDLTFGLLYAFSEKFALVFSHDEVVHGKCSLLSKMPGDLWQKFANLRLLLSYQMCQPGKKLLFMGGEIGQWNEWYCKTSLEWDLLRYDTHRGVQSMVRDINHFYLHNPALWECDDSFRGFEWVDFGDRKNSVISYLRKGTQEILLCVHNFTPWYCPDYQIQLRNVRSLEEVFNTDAVKYGGSGKVNTQLEWNAQRIKIQLAPLSTMIFRVAFQ